MRALVGWLTFLLAMAFAGCLLSTLVRNAWFSLPNENAVIGFFGFGVPMAAIGVGTAFLWHGYENLLKLLGWAATMIAIAHALAVLGLVAAWVWPEVTQPTGGTSLTRLLAFSVAAFMAGAFGIAMLYASEGKEI